MRCATLAEALRGKGVDVAFVCCSLPGNLIDWLKRKSYPVYELNATGEADTQNVIRVLKEEQFDWLVVDHYGLDGGWEKQMRPYVNRIFVIDDLANRPHDCDVLLDQNFYAKMEDRYEGLVPAGCQMLLGPKYALLRPEFSEAHRAARTRKNREVQRIFVFFGGSDPTDDTTKALEAIRLMNLQNIEVDVVVGTSNPNRQEIQRLCEEIPNTHFHCQVEYMAQLMSEADIAIGAGGTATWERLSVGLPSIVIAIASNQVQTSRDLGNAGYELFLGPSYDVTPSGLSHVLYTLLQNPYLRKHLASEGLSLVDAEGTHRIVQTVLALNLTLRPATAEDREAVYLWRNHEETRQHFSETGEISPQTHEAWFEKALGNSNRLLLIGEFNGNPVGVIRYDFDGTDAGITVYLVPGYYGKGYGPMLLERGSAWIQANRPEVRRLSANVLHSNDSARRAFERAGFKVHHNVYCKTLR